MNKYEKSETGKHDYYNVAAGQINHEGKKIVICRNSVNSNHNSYKLPVSFS